jgi:hypothetical protein
VTIRRQPFLSIWSADWSKPHVTYSNPAFNQLLGFVPVQPRRAVGQRGALRLFLLIVMGTGSTAQRLSVAEIVG